jgi:anti-sigma factor RsiW
MTHREIQAHLLLYLDGELPEQKRAAVDAHLRQCARCRDYMYTLKTVWQADQTHRLTPPPYLWTRIEARMREAAPVRPSWIWLSDRLGWLGRPALLAATLLAGILIGTYLGNPAAAPAPEESPIAVYEEESTLNAAYQETFQDIAPESVRGAYLIGMTEE